MLKFSSALFVVVAGIASCARAIRIDPPTLFRPGKYFAEDSIPQVTFNDPRCRHGDGFLPNPQDCNKYLVCRQGASNERECPEGFKFDSRRHCTPSTDADCGSPSSQSHADVICPEIYGYFPYTNDCHKFIVCINALPTVRTCPEGQVYQDNVGCVDGTVCPATYQQEESEESSVCQMADGLFPHPDCARYFKCVNFTPTAKECPNGRAFDPSKKSCTREEFSRCKNNDVQNILRGD